MSDGLRRQKLLFALTDSTAAFVAFLAALLIHDPSFNIRHSLFETNPFELAAGILLALAVWILVFREADLYLLRTGGLREAVSVVNACAIASILTIAGLFLVHFPDVSRLTLALAGILSVPLVLIFRVMLRGGLRRWYSNSRVATPVVIIGFNPVGHYLLDQLLAGMTNYEPLGFLDQRFEAGLQYHGYPLLGNCDELARLAAIWPRVKSAIAMPYASHLEQEQLITLCEQNRSEWSIVPWVRHSPSLGLTTHQLGALWLVGPQRSNIVGINLMLKRTIDLIAASALLIFATPIILIAAALIWASDGGPVFFRQRRVGMGGRSFELLKLRTMRHDSADTPHREFIQKWISNGSAKKEAGLGTGQRAETFKLVNDARVTTVGKYLRRFSIDELPQLINVLRGEMSLIGPRPALPYELELYKDWHRSRLQAAPGITGLWQVSGRNRLSFDEMVQLDLEYLKRWSLISDLKILLRTLPALVKGSGV